MDLVAVYAYLAGVVTVLSPCALPLLPVLLAGTASGGPGRPWGIVAGFTGGFLVFALGFSWLIQSTGAPPEALRWLAGALLISFGLVTAVPVLQRGFQQVWGQAAALFPARRPIVRRPGGFWSGTLIGLGLGLSWSPCVGPIMASVFTLSLTLSLDGGAVLTALAFSLGTGTVFLAVVLGGRGVLARVPWLVANLERLQRIFGVLMALAGLAVWAGWDRDFAAWVLRTFPGYGAGLTSWESSVVGGGGTQ